MPKKLSPSLPLRLQSRPSRGWLAFLHPSDCLPACTFPFFLLSFLGSQKAKVRNNFNRLIFASDRNSRNEMSIQIAITDWDEFRKDSSFFQLNSPLLPIFEESTYKLTSLLINNASIEVVCILNKGDPLRSFGEMTNPAFH
jgi:hypothetical protein